MPFAFVNAAVELEIPGARPGMVEFIIDTGAGRTVLSAGDAYSKLELPARLLSPAARWRETTTLSGVGGAALAGIAESRLSFWATNDEWVSLLLPLSIHLPASGARPLPSLIGWDVLQHMDFRVARSHGLVELDVIGHPGRP